MSQLSQASTVPYELSQDQDDLFLEDLNHIDQLYFQSRLDSNENLLLDQSQDGLEPEKDNDFNGVNCEINYESDSSECENSNVCVRNECDFDLSEIDVKERDKQEQFKTSTCGCTKFYQGQPCSSVLDFNALVSYREYCQELSRDELDLVIKSQIVNQRQNGPQTSAKKHKAKERIRPRQNYFFQGNRICRTMFCFLHNVEKQKLVAITKSLEEEGFRPRVHGLCGKLPANSLTFKDRENVKSFLVKYATDNALPLPGRLPHFKQAKVLLLPADKRQAEIHALYQDSAKEAGLRTISLSTFSRLWRDLCPHIVLAKPQTDLCFKCQQFSVRIQQSGGLEETEKIELLTSYDSHLKHAKMGRDFYREQCLEAKAVFSDNLPSEGVI